MPCNEINYASIDFQAAVGHLDVLADALREQGYTVNKSGQGLVFSKGSLSGSYSNGKFNTRDSNYGESKFDVDAVKVSFATGVLKKSARQYGWKVKSIGNNKYEVEKG